jgi:hypothetical protein
MPRKGNITVNRRIQQATGPAAAVFPLRVLTFSTALRALLLILVACGSNRSIQGFAPWHNNNYRNSNRAAASRKVAVVSSRRTTILVRPSSSAASHIVQRRKAVILGGSKNEDCDDSTNSIHSDNNTATTSDMQPPQEQETLLSLYEDLQPPAFNLRRESLLFDDRAATRKRNNVRRFWNFCTANLPGIVHGVRMNQNTPPASPPAATKGIPSDTVETQQHVPEPIAAIYNMVLVRIPVLGAGLVYGFNLSTGHPLILDFGHVPFEVPPLIVAAVLYLILAY